MTKDFEYFNFNRQEYFTRESFIKVAKIFKGFGEYLSVIFKKQFFKTINVLNIEFNQFTLNEFISSIPNPTLISVFRIPQFQNKGMIEMDLDIADFLTDEPIKFIDIAQSVLDALRDILNLFLNLDLKMDYFNFGEINEKKISIYEPNEVCLVITLKISVNNNEYNLNILLPYFNLFYQLLPFISIKNDEVRYSDSQNFPIKRLNSLIVTLNDPNLNIKSFRKIIPNAEYIWENYIQNNEANIYYNNVYIGKGNPLILENEFKGIFVKEVVSNIQKINTSQNKLRNDKVLLVYGDSNKISPSQIQVDSIIELNQLFSDPLILTDNKIIFFKTKIIQFNNESYYKILHDENLNNSNYLNDNFKKSYGV